MSLSRVKSGLLIPGIVIISFISFIKVSAQSDSLTKRNLLKLNLSTPAVWGLQNIELEYERILSEKNSLVFGAGYRTLPKLIGFGPTDSAFVVRNHQNKGGYNVMLQFRHYFVKENKYPVPRGLYIAPFFRYFTNNIENNFKTFYNDIVNITLNSKIQTYGAGFQVGYQFILFEKLSFDFCFFGPSITQYRFKTTINSEIDIPEDQFFEDLNEKIKESYPLANLISIDDKSLVKKGHVSKLFLGYRYYVTVGYHF